MFRAARVTGRKEIRTMLTKRLFSSMGVSLATVLMAVALPASAQVSLGNLVGGEIHVASLESVAPDLPYKLGHVHVAASMGKMRDVSQGNFTTTGGGHGAYRFLTEGQQDWERGCNVLLLAPNFPPTTDAWVAHGNFNQPGGFNGFPNFSDKTLNFHLLSTPNFSFQPTTLQPEGGNIKWVSTFTFKHAILVSRTTRLTRIRLSTCPTRRYSSSKPCRGTP
jgi:hypothetical protein